MRSIFLNLWSMYCVAETSQLRLIDQQMVKVIMSSWADTTWATRNSQWKRFLGFCGDINACPLPADVLTVCRFLVVLGQTSKFATVTNYLSAINGLHRYYGHEIDFRSYFMVKLILSGLRRILGGQSVPKDPLTPDQLRLIYIRLIHSEWNELCWLAILFSFRTLLRKSNYLPDGSKNDHHLLRRKDIEWGSEFVVINVHSTKTLLKGERVLRIPLHLSQDYVFDVVSRLRHHFVTVPADGDSYLFLKRDRKGNTIPLMYKDVLQFIKKAVLLIGLDPQNIGLHSLRRSGASFLHSIGIPLEDIRMAGDWRLMAVLLYLVNPFSRKLDLELKIASALNGI